MTVKTFFEWLNENADPMNGFTVYNNMTNIDQNELAEEYKDEIAPAIQNGECRARWELEPQDAQRIFGDANQFLQLAQNAQVQTLPPSVLRGVHNYSQVTTIIDNYLRNPNHNPQIEIPQQQQFFGDFDKQVATGATGGMVGNVQVQASQAEINRRKKEGGQGPPRTKLGSYDHKVGLIQQNLPVSYPILLHHNGKYYHVSGATRQTAAVSHKMVLPVKVIMA